MFNRARYPLTWLAALGLFWLFSSPVFAVQSATHFRPVTTSMPSIEPQLIGQAGGPTGALALQGQYAYLGVGQRVLVLNVADPAQPVQIGASAPFAFFVEGVAVQGDLAFVAAGEAGLSVLNVSDPVHPIKIGAWDSPGYAEGVATAGQYVFLADGPYGLHILDVSDPTHPTTIGAAYSTQYVFDVTLAGKYAYLSGGGAGVLLVDVSNPLYPVEIGTAPTPGYTRGVAVAGHLAFVADGWEGVRVMDVTDVTQPQAIGFYQTPGQAFGVAVAGNRLYVADAFAGLQIVDISTPAHPIALGGYAVPREHVGTVIVAGNTAYLADRNWGMRIVDVATPTLPAELSEYTTFSTAQSVAVSGDYAYVAASYFGLHVIDLTDPARPIDLGGYALDEYARAVVAAGHYVYLITQPGALYIFDSSDPAQLVLTGTNPEGLGITLTYDNGYVYIVNEAGLAIIDVSDPFNPHLSSFLQIQEPPGPGRVSTTDGVAVRGAYAYVAASGGGLKVVDVSQPSNPQIVATCSWPDNVIYDVKLAGNFAYLVDWGGGNSLAICDISDPLHPSHRSSLALPEAVATTIQRLVVHDSWVYLAVGSQGLAWVDVTNPDSPVLAGHLDTAGYANDLYAANNRVFVADDEGGLMIYSETALHAVAGSAPTAPLPHHAPSPALTNRVHPITSSFPPRSPAARTKITEISRPATVAATCTVTSTADSGPGTLRQCLQNAASGGMIDFNPVVFPPTQPVTIAITSAELPCLCGGHQTIDASSAGVILDGSQAPANTVGLVMGSSYNTIKGLQIVNFPQAGLIFGGTSTNNQIGGNRTHGSGPLGEGNLISGNHGPAGIQIASVESVNNIFQGNLIGVDASGTKAYPNNIGMLIGSSGNLIGGSQPGERNIVSGNHADGITLHGAPARRNWVLNNYAGVDVSGHQPIPNGTFGVGMDLGANNNRVEGNVIAPALLIYDWGSSYNVVVGNRINIDASGTVELGSTTGYVVTIGGGAGFNRIGGKTPAERNIIVGQVALFHKPEIGNMILGNYLGTDVSGLHNFPVVGPGIGLIDSRYVFIGGNTPGEANLIGGPAGINLAPGVSDVFILGNVIGPDANGGGSLQHDYGGFWLNGSTHTFIQDNTLAYFDGPAAQIDLAGPNTLRQNSIYSNSLTAGQPAILLQNGGNDNLAAPSVTLNSTGLTGTTCLSCTVEFFFDAADEGRIYLGSATADADGVFSHSKVCPVSDSNLTATTTDRMGNTSAFAVPQIIPWDCSTPNPRPTLSDLAPITITALSHTFLLTVNGVGFVDGSQAQWNGINLPTTVVSGTRLMAVVPSARINVGGYVSVTVSNPAPSGGNSNPLTFTIDNPIPTLISLMPSNVVVTSQGFTLTVNGSNFVNQSVVRWNGTNLTTTHRGETQLLAYVPVDYLGDAGNAVVSVFNPAPGGGASGAATFTILPVKKVYLPILMSGGAIFRSL